MTLRVGALINGWVPEVKGKSRGLLIRMQGRPHMTNLTHHDLSDLLFVHATIKVKKPLGLGSGTKPSILHWIRLLPRGALLQNS